MSLETRWKVYSTWAEVESLWPQVFEHVTFHTIFQELSIQKSWWLSAGKPELKIVVAFEGNQPIAIFPFCQKEGILQLLGDEDVTDYLDLLVLTDKTQPAFEALRQFLASDKSWQKLQLISLPENSYSFKAFQDIAQDENWNYQRSQQNVCPVIELPQTWDEYLKNVGKKQRHEIKRKAQRLDEQGTVTYRLVTDTTADPKSLETFFTLHEQSSLEKAAFWTPEHRKFFEELSSAASKGGWLRLFFLDFDGVPAAAMYCLEYQSELLIYNSGFNAAAYAETSMGHVLTAYLIKESIEKGLKRFDFLRGGEEYKLRYRPIVHPIFNVLLEKPAVE